MNKSKMHFWFLQPATVNERNWFVWSNYLMGILGLVISIWTLYVPVQRIETKTDEIQSQTNEIQDQTNQIQNQLDLVTNELKSQNALDTLKEHFIDIEQGRYDDAWNIFSEQKKANTAGGIEKFKNDLENFVAFEGFRATEITEKVGVSSKVYITEFDFKQRGMQTVHYIWGITLKFNGEKWQIEYLNVLYKNGPMPGACQFYAKLDFCILEH